ncbi:MAG: Transposase family protein [Syntrophaceae bacterium]|nr:MAG: Transposase family protein [Syntrophaceae bacterium]
MEATREALGEWVKKMKDPWDGAMEATLFTGWVYDFLKPHAHKREDEEQDCRIINGDGHFL